jgi:hypothetical protein
MTQPIPNCPSCRVPMARGTIIDPSHGANRPAMWVASDPTKGVSAKLSVAEKQHIGIVSFRCPQCGCLVNFAP